MLKLGRMFFVTSLACLCTHAQASINYVATPQESDWQVTIDTPIECKMEHNIPRFGNAMFTSRASKNVNLAFELAMFRPMGSTEAVNLVAMPARWQPGESVMRLGQVKFFKQMPGYVDGQMAWQMLTVLDAGRFPTFNFRQWQEGGKRVNVGLSAVKFSNSYNEFSLCVSKLLPYSFKDIAFSVLHYERASDELTEISRNKLAQISEFLRYSPDIDLVLLTTYTDSFGGKAVNQRISEQRAQKLEAHFMSLGLPKERIEVKAFGERDPIATNDTPQGRNLNRRVVISLERSITF